ncbi:MAG: hypothetical protein P1U74_05915 [Legionellaceae bacterium]|nr:hypothetical protein [Legionellaceae bacterium]
MTVKSYFFKGVFLFFMIAITNVSFANEAPVKENTGVSTIQIYESEDGNKVIENAKATTPFIKIYQKGDWIKVGNPENGNVGWINHKQYQKAMSEFNKPDIQTIFISKSVNADNKPQVNIIAYKNGKPVSKEVADELYKKFKHQEDLQNKAFEDFNHKMLNQWHGKFYRLFYQDPFLNLPLFLVD